ncbi:FUSC family protein [Kineococcus auxinigenes]|uniref:FUSC family protein n=1 Tax=unclassified Kineococcus TaxID=2621656 RepID=UPI003D7D395E
MTAAGWGRAALRGTLRAWRARRPRARLWPVLAPAARLTAAAVVSYLLTLVATRGPVDLTGSLTSLLVLQASATSSLKMAVVRVGAVLTGVLVAVALSTVVGLSWWSLAVAVGSSLLLAAVLRLGAQALETPISAMLVLAVGGQGIAAETRLVTTFIGAGVGIAFSVLVPPPVPTRDAVGEVRAVAQEQAECLIVAGTAMANRPVTEAEVTDWLERARAVADVAGRASAALGDVRDLRRFNPRALATADVEPVLRTGLEALDSSLLALRALFVAMRREAPAHASADDGYGSEVRAAFAVVLTEVAACLDEFGALLEAEASGAEEEVEQRLAQSLQRAGEARATLTELLLVDAREQTSLWLLRGTVLLAVEQVLLPLDLETRARVRAERPRRRPLLAATAPVARRVLPDPVVRRLRRAARARAAGYVRPTARAARSEPGAPEPPTPGGRAP